MENERGLVEYMLRLLGESKAGQPSARTLRSSSQIASFTDDMPGGFFIYRASGDEEVLYANRALLRIFGCASMEEFRELTGGTFKGMVHREDLEAVEKSIWEQIAHNQYDLDYVEYRIVQKSGEVRWLEDYGHFIHSDTLGDVFCVFVGDATEKHQRRMEELETLDQERVRHLEVIESLSAEYESILYVDLEKNTAEAYRASRRLGRQFSRGVRPFDQVARDYVDAHVDPADQEAVLRALDLETIRRRLASGKGYALNYRIVQETEVLYLRMNVVPVGSGGGSKAVVGVRSVDRDMRREIQSREAMERALKLADAAMLVKNTFMANMSHDMRTPLNAVMGFAALAKNQLEDREKLLGYLERIEDSGAQLLRLIDSVLELSRLEAVSGHPAEEKCDLQEIVRRVYKEYLPEAESKGLILERDTERAGPARVYSDAGQLENLLRCLTDNAVKYTPSGGRVRIALERLEEMSGGRRRFRLTVSDNGAGMSKSFLNHAFDPFEREKNTTESGHFGAGLGLTIVKSIADLLGGEIQVESAQERGSTFTVTLPLRMAEDPGLLESDGGQAPGRGKILVVEDNPLNLEITQEILEGEGFATDSAANGALAVEKIVQSPAGEYALVLMDIQMPVMDGRTAARTIRALEDREKANIPIVAVSANAFEEDRRASLDSGMNGHLAKPIQIEELLALVRRYVVPSESGEGIGPSGEEQI